MPRLPAFEAEGLLPWEAVAHIFNGMRLRLIEAGVPADELPAAISAAGARKAAQRAMGKMRFGLKREGVDASVLAMLAHLRDETPRPAENLGALLPAPRPPTDDDVPSVRRSLWAAE